MILASLSFWFIAHNTISKVIAMIYEFGVLNIKYYIPMNQAWWLAKNKNILKTCSEDVCQKSIPKPLISIILPLCISVSVKPVTEWYAFPSAVVDSDWMLGFLETWLTVGVSVFPRFLQAISYVFPVMLMIAWVLFISDFVRKLVHERELRLHEVRPKNGQICHSVVNTGLCVSIDTCYCSGHVF